MADRATSKATVLGPVRPDAGSGVTAPLVLACVLSYVWYFLLIVGPSLHVFGSVSRQGTVFNDMLLHLLHGRFDVDPELIRNEGFVVNGRTYSYFGILPALLRLPFIVFDGWAATDFTQMSLLAASCISGTLLVRTALLLFGRRPRSAADATLFWAMTWSILLGGVEVPFLRPTIYQEPFTWGLVFASWFVGLAVRGIVCEAGFSPGLLGKMGLAAGLALMTRVTTGLALYASLCLLLAVFVVRGTREGRLPASRLLAAGGGMVACGLCVAAVNYGRWGNPFVFADYRHYIFNAMNGFSSPMFSYGQFNLRRLGLGIIYYFFPVWGVPGTDAEPFLLNFRNSLVELTEPPPGSFLLTDPLLMWFAALAVARMWRLRHRVDVLPAMAILAGLAVPCALLLTAYAMSFRYRCEFYPFLYLLAFVGAQALRERALATRAGLSPVMRAAIWTCVAIGIIGSHASLVLFRISSGGRLDQTFSAYYGPRLLALKRSLLHRLP